MYTEVLGQKLKNSRENAGYSQQEIEILLKINQSTLSQYENGRRIPPIETIGKLADFYCVSVDWLLGTKGGKKD